MNEEYFQHWSPDMAYVLGFIVADGCIVCHDGAYQLIVSCVDRDLVEFIRDELEYTPTVKKCKDGCYRLSVCRKRVVMDLMAHGILPRKSWSPLVPDVPTEYHEPFIHGLFDGDGSVWTDWRKGRGKKSRQYRVTSSITSYSKEFLQGIGGIIKRLNGSIPKIYGGYGDTHTYHIVYSNKESIALYHTLYDNPLHKFYLGRKKEVFEDWLLTWKHDLEWGLRKCRICATKFVALHDKSTKCLSCSKRTSRSCRAVTKR